MELGNNINENIQNMHSTSLGMIIMKNLSWLLVFLFAPTINYIITIIPSWKDGLEDFKLIGGAVIVLLVIVKLLMEIVKLIKK